MEESAIRIDHMRQRHITNAERRKFIHIREVVVDHVPTLDAHKHGNLVRGKRAANLSGRGSKGEVLRMKCDLSANGFNLFECALHGNRPGYATGM